MGSLLSGNRRQHGAAVITIQETRDFGIIRSILTDPSVYESSRADGALAPAEFKPCEHEGVWYALVLRESAPVGVWMLVPHSAICYEIHTALLPVVRGKDAVIAAQLMKQWVWDNTPCLRLITNVPAFNRRTAMFCRIVGMKQFGLNEKSFMKNGRLHDQLMFGISKPGVS